MAITDAYSVVSPCATGKITCGGWLEAGKNDNDEGSAVQRHPLSRFEHKQLNPGVYGVERVCSTKVLSFFKYQSVCTMMLAS